MDIPELQKQIKELQKQTASYSSPDNNTTFSLDFSKIYIIIPIAILLLLIIFRPSFIYLDKTDEKGQHKRSFSFQKLFIYWIIISVLLIIGFYAYKYNQ